MERVQGTYTDDAVVVTPAATVVDRPAAAVVAPAGVAETRAVVNRSIISPASIAGGALGVALTTFGAVTLARAGLDTPLDDPVVGVFGTTATAIGGIIVGVLGVLMLISALSRSREAVMFFALVGGIGAFVIAIEPDVGNGSLGLSSGFAWLVTVASAAVVAIAGLMPTIRSTSERIQHTGAI